MVPILKTEIGHTVATILTVVIESSTGTDLIIMIDCLVADLKVMMDQVIDNPQ